MFATYLTAGLCAWLIAAMFAMAFIRGATGRRSTKIQHRECEQ